MNDQMKNTNHEDIAKKINAVAEQTNVNPHFVAELELKLKAAHKPRTSWSMPAFKQTTSTLSWIALVIMLGFFLNWSFTNLIPTGQPGANTTPNQFVCPVTEPNGSVPPGETITDPNYLGNDKLWTVLWPNGKIYMTSNDQRPDGTLSMKWGFWRGANGALTVEGHRLDAESEPLRVDIPDGYGDTGFQVLGLYFPTTGCWEVTGRVGESSLTFVTEVVFDEATPAPPEPIVVTSVITAPPEDGGYAWRDTKMYLAQPLPQSPIDAQVYSLKLNQPVTKADVLVLAQRFGIQGEVQELPPDFSNGIGYMLTDGIQKLEVQSNNYFTFYTNYTSAALGTVPEEQARITIDGFLKKYGFNFEYHVERTPELSNQQYAITPLTPDGIEIRSDYLMPIRYVITIDGTGQNIIFSGYPLDYEATGTFQIITVEDAFQSVLNDNLQFGRMEMFLGKNGGGGGGGPGFYKLNLSGTPVSFPTTTAQPEINFGTGDYTVKAGDTLASIANNFGVSVDELMKANNIADPGIIYIDQKLIIPSTSQQNLNSSIGKRFDGIRGTVLVEIYQSATGNQRTQYYFVSQNTDGSDQFYVLEGANLQDYQNRVINVWGTIDRIDENFYPVIRIESFEDPYPEADFQILRGTQNITNINGQDITLLTTTDGKIYAEYNSYGEVFAAIFGDINGKESLLEVLILPNETFGNYPVLRVFSGVSATESAELNITADQIPVIQEQPQPTFSPPPTANIEKVELVYYLPNPLYGNTNPGAEAKYIQPAWRFYGHYSNGDEFEILVQALKQEYLLPQLAPYTPPG